MGTILIIEDQKDTQQLLTAIFDAQHLHTVIAPNASAGIELAREFQPILILMDLMLPDQDGWITTAMMKADDDLKHIPIVIMTAATFGDLEARLEDVGADGFVSKPFNVPILLEYLAPFLGE